jgi:SAM-dependent methyltransferase
MASPALDRLYPERQAGGFYHDDQVMMFFLRVHSLLKPEMTLLDFGAGRGLIADRDPSFVRDFQIFKGRVAKVIGADIDPVVNQNPVIDEAILIGPNGELPLPDESVDIVVSCATFEHLPDPEASTRELERVVKPGGWICAWTPNKWGYVALAARMVPNSLHARAVRIAQPGGRGKADVFPTHYRINTKSAVRRYFPERRFKDCSYYIGGSPSYNAGRVWLARLLSSYNNAVPRRLKKNLHVFVQKKT